MMPITKQGILAEMQEAKQSRKCACCSMIISHHFEPKIGEDDQYDLVCDNCQKRTPWNMEAMFHRIQMRQVII